MNEGSPTVEARKRFVGRITLMSRDGDHQTRLDCNSDEPVRQEVQKCYKHARRYFSEKGRRQASYALNSTAPVFLWNLRVDVPGS